jgi:hypothetical protein
LPMRVGVCCLHCGQGEDCGALNAAGIGILCVFVCVCVCVFVCVQEFMCAHVQACVTAASWPPLLTASRPLVIAPPVPIEGMQHRGAPMDVSTTPAAVAAVLRSCIGSSVRWARKGRLCRLHCIACAGACDRCW